jgi:DNA-directed RNA polymerase specialized sigma24 family protein
MSMDSVTDEFEAFVRGRTPALLRTAYLLTGDQHLAEDLVQSALARAHRAWRGLRDGANAEAYTRKIMYHLQVSWWRRRRVPESLPGQLPEAAPAGRDSYSTSELRLVPAPDDGHLVHLSPTGGLVAQWPQPPELRNLDLTAAH